MPTIDYTRPTLPQTIDYQGVSVVQWPDLANGDDGRPIELPNFADRSVQVTGVFGGGNLRIEGSIDGVNYATLTDPQGNALDIGAAKIESISEAVRMIRPRVTAGDGTTSLTCTILFKR